LTEFTSPYSLNTQRGWHTSKLLRVETVFNFTRGEAKKLQLIRVELQPSTP